MNTPSGLILSPSVLGSQPTSNSPLLHVCEGARVADLGRQRDRVVPAGGRKSPQGVTGCDQVIFDRCGESPTHNVRLCSCPGPHGGLDRPELVLALDPDPARSGMVGDAVRQRAHGQSRKAVL